MIEVELPDGTIVEFPEGTSPDVMRNALMKLKVQPSENVVMSTPDGGRVVRGASGQLSFVSPSYSTSDPAAIERIMRGASAGELAQSGAREAIIAEAPVSARLTKFVEGPLFIGSYLDEAIGAVAGPEAKTGVRALSGAMQAERPGQSLGLGLLGGITGSMGALAAAPASLTASVAGPTAMRTVPAIWRGLLVGAPLGAVEGAIYGAGAGREGERAESAITGGAIGGIAGGLLGAASPLFAKGAENVIGMFRRSDVKSIAKEFGISEEAAKVIRMTFDQGGGIDDARAALMRAGEQGMLADAGYAAQTMLDLSIAQGGAGAQIGREAVNARSAGIEGRLTQALDDALGQPQGIESLRRTIREASAPERQRFYNEAFGVEIDWNSPAGQELRGLLQTTPPEVFGAAARTRAMAARADDMTARYASEFAPPPAVTTTGPMSPITQLENELAAFLEALAEPSKVMKRPLTNVIKRMGGIDPASPAARELYSLGVDPKTTPGLFRKGGLKELDNLDAASLPDMLRDKIDEGGTYINRQALLDAIADEMRDVPTESFEDAAARAARAELEAAVPYYEARQAELRGLLGGPDAPAAPGDVVPMKTVKDIDAIKRALQEIQDTNEGRGLMGGQTEYGMEAGKRAREIRDLLAEISPAYSDALATASDTIQRTKAVRFGADMLSPNVFREEVADFLEKATPGERMSAALGMRQRIDETIANVKASVARPDVDIAQGMQMVRDLSSPASREKIEAVVGKQQAAPLFKALDESMAQLELRAIVARGSATAPRQFGAEMVKEITAPGAFGQVMRGEPINTGRALVQAVTGYTDEFTAAQRQKVYADIAKALTEKKGASARAALNYIDQAMKGQPLTAAQNEFVAQQVAGALFAIGTPALSRQMGNAQ